MLIQIFIVQILCISLFVEQVDILKKKYLVFASTDKNKKVLAKQTELWNKIKYLIKTINGEKEIDYGKD